MEHNNNKIKVGCGGFALAQQKYFESFPCVEINSSFYQLPRIETATRWAESAPAGFQFSMKAWQVITHPATSPTYEKTRIDSSDLEHCGHFDFNPTIRWAWEQTYAIATKLRVFCVVFQSPQSFRQTKENIKRLERFFNRAKRGNFQLGWEPRADWDATILASLCRDLEILHIINPLKSEPAVERKFRYYRLNGTTGTSHRHSFEELQKLKDLWGTKKPTYYFFNNTAMVTDARRLLELIGKSTTHQKTPKSQKL